MDSGRGTRALPRVGFPIRRPRDQRLVSTSPGLIAAAHVLLRLLAPRHPPCALHLLIVKNTVNLPLWSFQGARSAEPQDRRLRRFFAVATTRSLKTQQRTSVEVDVFLGETLAWTAESHRLPPDSSPRRGVPRRAARQAEPPAGVRAPDSLERR